jgi:hypothetical protein
MLAESQGRGQIIWPIAVKLFQSVMLQQRPRWTGGRGIISLPVLPWNTMNRPAAIGFYRYNLPPIAANVLNTDFGLCALGVQSFKPSNLKPSNLKPSVVHSLQPLPTEVFKIIGVSKDSSDAVLPNCTMCLFRLDRDSGNNIVYTHLGNTISDASGNYVFIVNKTSTYRVTGENGLVVGMTLNTLTGVLV